MKLDLCYFSSKWLLKYLHVYVVMVFYLKVQFDFQYFIKDDDKKSDEGWYFNVRKGKYHTIRL